MWPSVLTGADHAYIFAARQGKVVTVGARMGEHVDAGEMLAVLNSPVLDYQLAQARAQQEILRWEIANAGISGEFSAQRLVATERLNAINQELMGASDLEQRMTIISPIAGMITEPQDDLSFGQWVSEGTALFKVVDFNQPVIEGYVRERDLSNLHIGAEARFYFDNPDRPSMPLTLTSIDTTAIAALPRPLLAAVHGGQIATRKLSNGTLVPEEAYYRVFLEATGDVRNIPERTLRGVAQVSGPTKSLAERTKTLVWSILIRESGY